MAVKTITIDLEAYDRLSRLKDGGLSFSQVIKKYLPAPGETAADLLATLDDMGDDAVTAGTLDVVEATVRDRRLHAVRVPTW